MCKPKFNFISHEQDPKLYNLEERVSKAIGAVARHRHEKYGEDYWKQAMVEVLYNILDDHGFDQNLPAVEHWLTVIIAQQASNPAQQASSDPERMQQLREALARIGALL